MAATAPNDSGPGREGAAAAPPAAEAPEPDGAPWLPEAGDEVAGAELVCAGGFATLR